MPTRSEQGHFLTPLAALNVDLDDITDVGPLYIQSKHPADKLLGRNLLLCASRAGSLSATIFLVYTANRQKSLHAVELVKPKAHLKSSVQSGTTNVQALVLQGLLYRDQKLYKEAASCFKKAIAVPEQDKDADETRLSKILRWIGFDLDTKDPNLDQRRPQDFALDHVEAYIQLATLPRSSDAKANQDAIENLKIAALKYDEPRAYFHLTRAGTTIYTYEWLLYMLKAAASGYGSAMENIAELLSFSEKDLEIKVPDRKVRDWVLNSPVYDQTFQKWSLNGLHRGFGWKQDRTIERYKWAIVWHLAAEGRAEDSNKLVNYAVSKLQWAIADLLEETGMPLSTIRRWRVHSMSFTKGLQQSRNVDTELRKESEVIFRQMEQSSKGQEAQEIYDHWVREGCRDGELDEEWIGHFLEAIDDVPAGAWRRNKRKPARRT